MEVCFYNVISYKFCQSSHISNEIKKEILTVYPCVLGETYVKFLKEKRTKIKKQI